MAASAHLILSTQDILLPVHLPSLEVMGPGALPFVTSQSSLLLSDLLSTKLELPSDPQPTATSPLDALKILINPRGNLYCQTTARTIPKAEASTST